MSSSDETTGTGEKHEPVQDGYRDHCGTCWRGVEVSAPPGEVRYRVSRAPWPCENARLRERVAALTGALDRCMIGGNHIASALISALGPDFNEIPSFDAALERLWGTRADTDDMVYEAWMCWRAIMDARTLAGGPDWKTGAALAQADDGGRA